MKKDRYIFYAVFESDDEGIAISFPDVPGAYSCANNFEEAFTNAKECLALHLFGMESDKDLIPEPTLNPKEIKLEKNQSLVLIEVYMPLYRNAIDNRAVKKTLTIPRWLERLADEKKVNYSQILQKALKEYLDISKYE